MSEHDPPEGPGGGGGGGGDARLGSLVATAAARWGEREFLVLGAARLSFADLDARVNAAARHLVAAGTGPGERVLLQAGNGLDLVVLTLAAWRIGAICVPVVPIYRRRELAAIVADTRPAVIAAAEAAGSRSPCAELDEVLTELGHAPRLRVLLDGGSRSRWSAVTDGPSVPLPDPAGPDECCAILYTSGTTSAPKGARISGRAMLANLHNWCTAQALTAQDVTLTGAPLAHIGGLQSLLIPLLCGGRAVVLPQWDADVAVATIEAERVTLMSGPPVFLADLVERYERGAGAGPRLGRFLSGGAATPSSLIERAEAVGVVASRCYGMTETVGTIAQSTPDDPLPARRDTDGRLLPGTQVRVVDDAGVPVPAGELGHLQIRSGQLMLGYTDPALTVAQLTDGWFFPGDLGRLDADGRLTMAGRSKDIINRGGEKFSAQDIEAALAACPGIREAAVVGLPDERLGEKIGAFLVLSDGVAWTGPEPVLAALEAARLARPKYPVAWFVLDELPRTASGKVQKNLLLVHAEP